MRRWCVANERCAIAAFHVAHCANRANCTYCYLPTCGRISRLPFSPRRFPKPTNQTTHVETKRSKAEIARLNGKKGGRPRKGAPKPTTHAAKPTETHETQKPTDEPKALENTHGLTPRELLFVTAYCGPANFNASEAYRLAGFEGKPKSVTANAARLIASDRVSKAVAVKLAEKVERLEVMDGDEAMGRLTRYARADIGQVLGPDDPLAQLPDDVRLCIKSVRPTRYGRTIELYDAMKATADLAEAAGRLKHHHEHKHTGPVQVVVSGADERL